MRRRARYKAVYKSSTCLLRAGAVGCMGSTAEISPGWCDHRSSRDSVVGLARELLQGYRAQGTPDRTRSRFVQPKGWPTTLLDWAPVQDTQGDHQGANGLPRMLTHMDYDHMYVCAWM